MTQVAFNAIGSAIGGPVGGAIGSMIGSAVDAHIVNSLQPTRQVGPRLEGLKFQGSGEGAPLACVFGRARVAGHVIWAARFLEQKRKQSGGKGRARTYDYGYSLSFAVGLGEGEIDGLGRIWADGLPMDLKGVTWRLHRGGEMQMPDPLIEAVEGQAPAYRGTAYVVFEDLPLEAYGNRVPQLSFEVFRRARGSGASRLEDRLEGVCLIPGAGEFCLASELVKRREGLTRSVLENGGSGQGRADLEVSLDQLVAQLPNVKRVNLVVGWFGTDMRAGHCRIIPGVERRGKVTVPQDWQVAGLDRAGAHLISRNDAGDVAYGGTPSDETVRQAIRAIRARGLQVKIYPFVFMDCENYPWRGRIAGTDGVGAVAEMATLFGEADGGHWGLRRQVLHYARMAAEEGAHGLVIGSEMRGVTLTRDAAGGFPAVAQYQALAAECRTITGPQVELTYAADWSEYAGLRQEGEVRFHLDPLWADPNIDYVGIDWYPPMGDWRAGDGGLDAQGFSEPEDDDYLAAQVAGGRDYDWYYASAADEIAQKRTPIVDGAYGEDWVWRVKDLKGWWSNRHYERVGGVRLEVPTPWQAGMKPIRLLEFGCAAVDRGGNAPNLFLDPKSSESALPPYSDGTRNDRMQRALMEAVLGHYALAQNNPVSAIYGGAMLAGADAWCWDARPWPAFPARADLWADAGAWRTGHWLNGRMQGAAGDLVEALLRRAGLAEGGWRVEGVKGTVAGLVVERPMTTRAVLEGLLLALGAVASERDGQVVVSGEAQPVGHLSLQGLALADEGDGQPLVRVRELREAPQAVRVRYVQETGDYQTGAVVVRTEGGEGLAEGAAPINSGVDVDLALVTGAGMARQLARRVLAQVSQETRQALLGPLEGLALEAADVVSLEGEAGTWRARSLDYGEVVRATLEPVIEVPYVDQPEVWPKGDERGAVGAPWVRFLDLPPLAGSEEDARPLVAVAADPWWPMVVHGGAGVDSLTVRIEVPEAAFVGELVEPLGAGCVDRWDEINEIVVRLEGGNAQSLSDEAVLNGGNVLAIETAAGWELLQYRQARTTAYGIWALSGLLRARQGTEVPCERGAGVGAAVVVIDEALVRVAVDEEEAGLPRLWRIGPKGLPPGGADFTEAGFIWERRQARPWRPVHVRGIWSESRLDLSWVGRSRIGADSWEREAIPADPETYRLRVIRAGQVMREWTVEGTKATYAKADFERDFPQEARVGDALQIAQKGRDGSYGEPVVYGLA